MQNSTNSTQSSKTTSKYDRIKPQIAPDCGPGYNWDAILRECVPYEGQPPAPDAAVPSGGILVFDTQTQTNLPVRKATIVARRWFKIERGYTDNTGHYQMTKRFKNKVRVNVKFKNGDAEIRGVRGFRLWQMLYPVKKILGIFSGDNVKNNINWTFLSFTDQSSKGQKYWAAATTHNAVQDYREYAPQEGIGLPPTGLKIILNNASLSFATMWNKRTVDLLPEAFVKQFLIAPLGLVVGGINALFIVLKHQIDIAANYKSQTSDQLKETVFHELTHAAHYAAVGNSWYNSFVDAEISEIIGNAGGTYSPYGQSTDPGAGIIALGESWAYYMGHYLADKQYGLSSSIAVEQGIGYTSNNPIFGFSSHLNLLEDFSPARTNDPFYWIPQGLFYDLKDSRNETRSTGGNVDDNVSGYTNQQMFNAFQSSIYTLQDYRDKLLLQNGNNQAVEITSLFTQYGY